jgi:hypothetical protein
MIDQGFGLWTGGGWEGSERAKPECPLDSESLNSRLDVQSRIRIVDRRRLIGLVFWVRCPGNRTKQRQVRVLMGSERLTQPRVGRCPAGGMGVRNEGR